MDPGKEAAAGSDAGSGSSGGEVCAARASLDNAWTAFQEQWNCETGPVFRKTIAAREATHERMAVGLLAARLCELSWAADRHCCYVHYLEGCPKGRGFSLSRPYEGEWQRY
ncbi:hypothetical protein F443_04472, partial [Phytophthora nicotianae P1569]